jgi:hypothetical protein
LLQKTIKKKDEEIAALRMEIERLHDECQEERSHKEAEAVKAAEAEDARKQVRQNRSQQTLPSGPQISLVFAWQACLDMLCLYYNLFTTHVK